MHAKTFNTRWPLIAGSRCICSGHRPGCRLLVPVWSPPPLPPVEPIHPNPCMQARRKPATVNNNANATIVRKSIFHTVAAAAQQFFTAHTVPGWHASWDRPVSSSSSSLTIMRVRGRATRCNAPNLSLGLRESHGTEWNARPLSVPACAPLAVRGCPSEWCERPAVACGRARAAGAERSGAGRGS